MTSEEIIETITKDILEHLTLDIKQLSNSHMMIQLKYKDKHIGDKYTIESKLKWYKDRGHGGGTYVESSELIINKL